MTRKEDYRKLVGEGKCPICREFTVDKEYIHCLKCRISKGKYDKGRRELALRKGICPRCFKNPVRPGNKKCKDCLIKQNKNYKYQPITDENKRQASSEQKKKRYNKLKEEGKCPKCQVEINNVQLEGEHFVYCPECRDFIAKDKRIREGRRKRKNLKFMRRTGIKKAKKTIRNERLQDAFQRASEEFLIFFEDIPFAGRIKIRK